MLSYNELKPGTYIVLDGQPYLVLDFSFLRMQQRKPVAQTKIKNLITGKTIEKNFQHTDKFDEAEIETKPIKYLYNNKGEFWFCPARNASHSDAGGEEKKGDSRFKLEESIAGECAGLLKPNSVVDAIIFDEKIIGIKLPVKVELKVVEAPPSTKGNTAQGGTKQVKVETGAMINVPMFINEGDIIRINTQAKEYVERAEKK